MPRELPAWLTEEDLARYGEAFTRTGFRGGLNYYRNFGRTWERTRAGDFRLGGSAFRRGRFESFRGRSRDRRACVRPWRSQARARWRTVDVARGHALDACRSKLDAADEDRDAEQRRDQQRQRDEQAIPVRHAGAE